MDRDVIDPKNAQMNSQFFWAVAWNVSELRHTHRLTQYELAEETGLSREQVSHIERGHGRISFDSLITLADYFEVKVAKLCEDVPRGRESRWRMRRSFLEKDLLKFTKVFSESPKIHWLTLYPRRFRPFKIQSGYVYDFVSISGHIMIEGPEVYEAMKPQEVFSIKGSVQLRMRSFSDTPKSEMLVIQSFVRDGI